MVSSEVEYNIMRGGSTMGSALQLSSDERSQIVQALQSGRLRQDAVGPHRPGDLVVLPDGRRARLVGLRGEASCLVLPEDSPLEGVSRRTLLMTCI